MKKEALLVLAIGILLSQITIIIFWSDAKYLTLVNVVLLLVALTGFAHRNFEKQFTKDVFTAMASGMSAEIITGKDLETLPAPVQNYLRYVGVVGKPKITNARITFTGQMREKGNTWFNFTSEQYNFFKQPARFFFMKATIKGLPTYGYHSYKNKTARMQIKLLSIFPVADLKGVEMFPTETVTFFNDMCLFAPSALIDSRITWEDLNNHSAKASFTNEGTSISATLYFNEEGQLINFVSHDRYSVAEMKTFPFSTPVGAYKMINGYHLPTYGEGVWHYPEGAFVYGKFKVKNILYNVSEL